MLVELELLTIKDFQEDADGCWDAEIDYDVRCLLVSVWWLRRCACVCRCSQQRMCHSTRGPATTKQ